MRSLIGALLITLAAASSNAQNLITNGTFDHDLSGWSYAPEYAAWSADDANASATSGSATTTYTGGYGYCGMCSHPAVVQEQLISVAGGATYEFSAKIKLLTPPTQASANVTFEFSRTDHSYISTLIIKAPLATTGIWQQTTQNQAIPPDATYVRVLLTIEQSAGFRAAFDDVSLHLKTVNPPTANFSWTPTIPITGAVAQFTDTSTGNPTSWSWDFGDASTATAQNPTHTYASTGTYTVRLTASNSTGTSTITKQVTVTSPSAPDLSITGFVLNHDVTFPSGTWVPCDITLRAGPGGWPGTPVELRVSFLDVRGVGHDSWVRWGDETELVRGHFVTDPTMPVLTAGQTTTVSVNVSAFAADYIDAIAVELLYPDNSLINGFHKVDERPLSVPFNTQNAGINCLGTVLTSIAPPAGGAWITELKDTYDQAKFASFFESRLGDLAAGRYYNCGVQTMDFVIKKAFIVSAVTSAKLPLANLIVAGINEISGFWNGTGGCGTLIAHGSLALWAKALVATTNANAGTTSAHILPNDAMTSGTSSIADASDQRSGGSHSTLVTPQAGCPTMVPDTNVFIRYADLAGTCNELGGTCAPGGVIAFSVGTFGYDFSCANHTFTWTFGDGTTPVITRSPQHTFPTAGTYTVTCIVENPVQRVTLAQTVRVGTASTPLAGVNAVVYEGHATITVRDANSGHTISADNTGRCETIIAGASCAATPDFITIIIPNQSASSLINFVPSASETAVVHVLQPSTPLTTTGWQGTTTRASNWSLPVTSGDTLTTTITWQVTPALQRTHNNATATIPADREELDPTTLLVPLAKRRAARH